jgi:hypothetical protein
MMNRLSLAALLVGAACAPAETKDLKVALSGKGGPAVVRVPLGDGTAQFKSAYVTGGPFENTVFQAQLTAGKSREAVFVFPANQTVGTVTLTLDTAESRPSSTGGKEPTFAWTDAEGDHPVLTSDGKPVLTYVRPKFDPSATPPKKTPIENPTIKVYHHLFDATGKVQLTNGPQGQFPHHRGIFFGFNRISYDGQQADVWHCRNGESEQHAGFVAHEAGPVYGGHTVKVSWNGRDGKPFATEERTLRVFQMMSGRLVEFESVVKTDREKVRLDGDPQHAGFHFRANVEVEKTKAETYFMSPEKKGDKGKEVNWEPKGQKGPVNRPWTAMSFVIGGKRYTCVYLDHPDNPKEARQSERAYGRVGTYFEYDLTKDKPLNVKYRLWVQEGEVTAGECELLSKAFVEPPVAKVK